MYLAQLATTSPHLLKPETTKVKVREFMEAFLEEAEEREIREEEVANGYKWSTLVPFMKLAYHPHSSGMCTARGRRNGTSKREVLNQQEETERRRMTRLEEVLVAGRAENKDCVLIGHFVLPY